MNKKGQAYAILAGVVILGIIVIVLLCILFPSFKQNLFELIGVVRGANVASTDNISQNLTT